MEEWANDEVVVVVSTYLEMLRAEVSGRPYVKVEHNRKVQSTTGRSKGAVEFKFCNVSAALTDLGLIYVDGYKPRSNYQSALRVELEERISRGDLDWVPRAEPRSRFASAEEQQVVVDSENPPVLDTYESALRRVATRSFGGSDVAVAPDWNDDGFWPSGSSAPGAEEAVEWLRGRAASGETAMVFLVGGPGNGKSYLSSLLVRGWEPVDASTDGLANRTYKYRPDGPASVVVVNDATISRDDGADAPLVADVEEAVARQDLLLANVNRGILFEELAGASPGLGREVVIWLADRSGGDANSEYVRARTFEVDGRRWPVVAVMMDVCSLLEARPEAAITAGGEPSSVLVDPKPYSVVRLSKRGPAHDRTTAAGPVVEELLGRVPDPSSLRVHDPFAANLRSLRVDGIRSGVLCMLRAAEIASGRRLTYRELWGSVARLLIGDSPSRSRDGDPMSAVPVAPPSELDEVLRLAGLRFHQSLFAASPGALVEGTSQRFDPVTALTRHVDPVKDARPGATDRNGHGWASPVLEAFAGHATGESPLKALTSTSQIEPDQLGVTSFDWWLDQQVVAHLQPGLLADNVRRQLVAWYGEYLLRLYAVAIGVPAFEEEVEAWTRAWRSASNGQLPQNLEESLRTLLFPSTGTRPGEGFLIPVLAARAEPLGRVAGEPTLAAGIPSGWALRSRSVGDQLSVVLRLEGVDMVELDLDFAMVREALACRAGTEGVTEYTDSASPRLERFRSTLLRDGSAHGLRYVVVEAGHSYELELG